MQSPSALANMIARGALKNNRGRTLTRTNLPELRWTGTRYTYVARIKGKKVKRAVVMPVVSVSPPRKTRKARAPRGPRAFKGVATNFANRLTRTFYLTPRKAYVLRVDGKGSLYSRKARYIEGSLITNLSNVPSKIRPKRIPRRAYKPRQ